MNRLRGFLLSGVIALFGLVAVASPAAAAGQCDDMDDWHDPFITSVSVSDVVTNAGGLTAAKITVRAGDDVAIEECWDPDADDGWGAYVSTEFASGIASVDVEMDAAGTNGSTFNWVSDFTLTSGSIYDGTFVGYAYFDKYDATNLWYAHATVDDNGYNSVDANNADTFRVRRNTSLTLNAGPEPIKRYTYLTIAGKAKYLDPYSGYLSYKNKEVRIYFKPAGSSTWTYKGSAWTNAYGNYSKRIKATRDGTWRTYHAGSVNYAAKYSAGDYVDTR